MLPEKERHPHWYYFLTLDEDLWESCRYVEPVEENFDTFSIEFARLQVGICAEIETVFKTLVPSAGDREWFDKAWRALNTGRDLPSQRVLIRRTGLVLRPWDTSRFESRPTPDWWEAYNAMKHRRAGQLCDAKFCHVLHAGAALYTLVICLYLDAYAEGLLTPARLFELPERKRSLRSKWGVDSALRLPPLIPKDWVERVGIDLNTGERV